MSAESASFSSYGGSERFRAEGLRAAFLSGGGTVGSHLAHDGHPGARAHLRVVRGKIGARHGEIERRQTVRLVLGVQQLFCRPAVLGAKAALLGGFVVLPVEDAVRSLEEPLCDLGLEIARRTLSPFY
jgi:hypothetical protein